MMKWLCTSCLVLASCGASPQPSNDIQTAIELARGVGDAVMRQKGLAEFNRTIPELVPLIDANKDTVITVDEVETFLQSAAANPRSVGLLIGTLIILKQ